MDTIDTRSSISKIYKRQCQKLLAQRDRATMVTSSNPIAENIAAAICEYSKMNKNHVSNVLIFLCCGDGGIETLICYYLLTLKIRIKSVILMDCNISNALLQQKSWFKENKIDMITSNSFADLNIKVEEFVKAECQITVHSHNADPIFDDKSDLAAFNTFSELMVQSSKTGHACDTMLNSRTLRAYAIMAMIDADRGDARITFRTHFPGDQEGIAMLIWSTWEEVYQKWQRKRTNKTLFNRQSTFFA